MPSATIEQLELQVIGLLIIAVLVATLARRVRIPYTVALVLTGLAVSALNVAPALGDVSLSPTLILLTFLPGLIFEAAYHLDLRALRDNLKPILLLAVPGVLISMAIIGYLTHWLFDIPLAEALLFGVLISATDPISVVALFKELGVDKRLGVIVEGESLLNDGAAIVVYSILSSIATGQETFVLSAGLLEFFITVLGGVGLGLVTGLLISELMKRTNDHVLDIALTFILAYGTYLLAEVVLSEVFSPVIAVVTAGIYVGNYASRGEYSAPSQVTITTFWEFVGFLLNSAVFLLIGLRIESTTLLDNFLLVLISVGIVLVARAAVVYVMGFIINRLFGKLPLKWAHVLFWGGLRGAVSVALALSLPLGLEARGLIQLLAFGYVMFSIIGQGLTIKPLLTQLGLISISEERLTFERERARMAMGESSIQALAKMREEHLLSDRIFSQVQSVLDERIDGHRHSMDQLVAANPSLIENDAELVQREVVAHQKRALHHLLRRGAISEAVYDEMNAEIDERTTRMDEEDWHPRSILLHGSEVYLPEAPEESAGPDVSEERSHLTFGEEEELPIMSKTYRPKQKKQRSK